MLKKYELIDLLGIYVPILGQGGILRYGQIIDTISTTMTEQNESHICRSCGHVGAPDWKSWDMVEHKQDGSTSEWSGSSPICAECGAYVCTKQEWLERDWGETDEHDKYFGRGLYSVMAIVLAFIASDFSFLPSWFGMAIIAIGILSLIHSMSSYSQTKKRYMQMREEE